MKRKQLSHLYARYGQVLSETGLLVLAFLTSLLLAPLAKVHYRNPYNISNQFNTTGFNPDNNFFGLVFIIIVTVGLFWGLNKLYKSKYAWLIKLFIAGFFVANYFVLHILTASHGYASGLGGLDNFHSGEQLSPANAYLAGAHLYSQIFYLRGAGIDAVFPAWGLSLFGKSIGSFLFMSDLFMVFAQLSFLF